jgi:hypothetical protein
MLNTVLNFAKNRGTDYSDKVLWCAMKYALCMDEGDAAEAVILTLEPRVKELGDRILADMLTAVERYLNDHALGIEEKAFAPEWSDVRAWLTAERNARTKREMA